MSNSDTHTRTAHLDSTRRWINANPSIAMVACIACMLVLMALVTTFMTGPLLNLAERLRRRSVPAGAPA